jgi:hypothetical protein
LVVANSLLACHREPVHGQFGFVAPENLAEVKIAVLAGPGPSLIAGYVILLPCGSSTR